MVQKYRCVWWAVGVYIGMSLCVRVCVYVYAPVSVYDNLFSSLQNTLYAIPPNSPSLTKNLSHIFSHSSMSMDRQRSSRTEDSRDMKILHRDRDDHRDAS